MALALFDMDKTLLAGDSDFLWGEYLCQREIVDIATYQARNKEFYEQYKRGELNISQYCKFSLQVLADNTIDDLVNWRRDFVKQVVLPLISPSAQARVLEHQKKGDTIIVITATNRFIITPVVASLGIVHLLATEPEMKNGRYTGGVEGTPCYQEGKVTHLKRWLTHNGIVHQGAYFYSDSMNDLPLLEYVDYPHVVNADPNLAKVAEARGWPQLSWTL